MWMKWLRKRNDSDVGKTNARRMIYIEVSYCPTSEKHREGTLIIILRLTLMDNRRDSTKATSRGLDQLTAAMDSFRTFFQVSMLILANSSHNIANGVIQLDPDPDRKISTIKVRGCRIVRKWSKKWSSNLHRTVKRCMHFSITGASLATYWKSHKPVNWDPEAIARAIVSIGSANMVTAY